MSRDWAAVLQEHQQVAAALADQGPVLDAIADAVVACLRAGRRVYTLGNGGSAADAQHIAGELLGRFRCERPALGVIALSANVAALTAIANDYGFERAFARQLEGLVQRGDVVWALSTSGNSPNVLAAARVAADRGATVVGFTGQTGGKLAPLCTHIFRAPNTTSDRIQEAHALAYHYICERVETARADR
jgi:D-sedoheptulose 7-phosphate isomerase